MSMDEEKGLIRVLKWAGIIALIAVPVFMVLQKKKAKNPDAMSDDDSNIFAAELEE